MELSFQVAGLLVRFFSFWTSSGGMICGWCDGFVVPSCVMCGRDAVCVVSSGGMMCGCGVSGVSVVMLLILGFVDLMFARCACMCPFVDGIGFGGHFRSCFVVTSGNVLRYPAEIALARVESAGEKSDRE